MRLARCLAVALACACTLVPAPARAQWAFSTFTGANYTLPSSITIERPEVGMNLVFDDVHYRAKPFISPPYYGARITRFLGAGRLGIEVEFLHIKVYARTSDQVRMHGTYNGQPIDARLPMNTVVARYNQTHGLNFLFANLVWRQPLGGRGARAALLLRGGAGPVRPGRDIVMADLNVQGYQFAGIGAQAAAGLEVRLNGWLAALAEYKFTHARPELNLGAEGHGRMTAASHNVVFGVTVGKH